jgi:hypothetical protein
MPGFPLAAIGAGLGLFAKQYQEQQAAAERSKMLQMQLALFQQQMRDRQGQNELANLDLGNLAGGTGIQPTPGGASAVPPIGGGMPFAPPVPPMSGRDLGGGLRAGGAQASGGSAGGGNWEVRNNNFAGMRRPGVPAAGGPMTNPSGWQSFDTPEAGIQGIANQLDRYASGATTGSPLTTIRQIVSTWAPPSENPTAQLIARASQVVGVSPDQPLDLSNPAVKGKLVEAMIRGEQGGNLPIDQSVITRALSGGGGPAAGAPASGQQMAQAGPQTATDAGPQDDLQAQIARIPLPSPPDLHLDEVRRRINATGARWEDKERMLQNYIAQHGPQAKAAYDQAMEQYKTQVGVVTEQFQHARNRREKLSDEERAPGPLIQRGDQTYVVNPRKRTATPVIDEITGQPLTDAQRLGGGGSGSASAGREKDIVTEIKRLDDEYAEANPNATKAERDSAHFANRKRAEKELTAAKTSETRSTLANIAMRKLRDEHPEWDGKDLLRESSKIIAQQTTDRNFAGGTGATQMRSLNTVADHLKLMQEYSKALRDGSMPFTDIPRLNQIIQFLAKERGMPEVTNFNVARDIMADEVVRLLTSTGGTEADRAGMQSRLAAAMSEYQQTGALTAFEKFTAGRFKGLEQGYARNDPDRIKDFRDNMMTPEARAIFTKGEGAGAVETAGPPPEAVQMLRNDKSPDAQKNFDAIFGVGAAAKALGGGAVPAATPGAL